MPAKRSFDVEALEVAADLGTLPDRTHALRPRVFAHIPDSVYQLAGLIALLVLVAWSVDRLNIDLERLPGLLGRMGATLAARYFPPNLPHVLQPDYLHSVFETLEMSYLATVLGIVLAIPLAWLAAANVSPARHVGYAIARFIIMACRSVHEMIWTILLVAVLG